MTPPPPPHGFCILKSLGYHSTLQGMSVLGLCFSMFEEGTLTAVLMLAGVARAASSGEDPLSVVA